MKRYILLFAVLLGILHSCKEDTAPPLLYIHYDQIDLNTSTAKDTAFMVISDVDWYIDGGESWITLDRREGSGSVRVEVSVDANYTFTDRAVMFLATSPSGVSASTSVTQTAERLVLEPIVTGVIPVAGGTNIDLFTIKTEFPTSTLISVNTTDGSGWTFSQVGSDISGGIKIVATIPANNFANIKTVQFTVNASVAPNATADPSNFVNLTRSISFTQEARE